MKSLLENPLQYHPAEKLLANANDSKFNFNNCNKDFDDATYVWVGIHFSTYGSFYRTKLEKSNSNTNISREIGKVRCRCMQIKNNRHNNNRIKRVEKNEHKQ